MENTVKSPQEEKGWREGRWMGENWKMSGEEEGFLAGAGGCRQQHNGAKSQLLLHPEGCEICPLDLTHHVPRERWTAAVLRPGMTGWSSRPIPTLNPTYQSQGDIIVIVIIDITLDHWAGPTELVPGWENWGRVWRFDGMKWRLLLRLLKKKKNDEDRWDEVGSGMSVRTECTEANFVKQMMMTLS